MAFVFLLWITLTSGNNHSAKATRNLIDDSQWTGYLELTEEATFKDGLSTRVVKVNFTNAIPTLNHSNAGINLDFTDDKGSGTASYHAETFVSGKKHIVTDCSGSGKSELHWVEINRSEGIYSISAIGPGCIGTSINYLDNGKTEVYGPEYTDIIVSNKPLGQDVNFLKGSEVKTVDIGVGKVTTKITWDLRRTLENVELIVTPANYDQWMPKPGRDEFTAGAIMNVSLKLQKRGGGPTNIKAKQFELKLINTSNEPGMTINFPVNSTNTTPDLRFILHSNGDHWDTTFQEFNILCSPPRQSESFKIGAFDGGGWTILRADAILEDDSRITGHLLVSNGDIDIRIPKREPDSHIAEAWVVANDHPGAMDDKENSNENPYLGDGYTAYEEYRGIIHNGSFKRLNPKKKELGILSNSRNFVLLGEGINRFKAASDLEIISFDIDRKEVDSDNRVNTNKKSDHDFDQYALHLRNGSLGGKLLGQVFSRTDVPDIPSQILAVVIDFSCLLTTYSYRVTDASPDVLKFSLSEYLAQTVAHELGHAVNVWHHGGGKTFDPFTISTLSNDTRIFDRNGNLITYRPITLKGIGEANGTVESGDLACMMNYYPYFKWGYSIGDDQANVFNKEPLIPLGKKFCNSDAATNFNTTGLYFGKAAKGKCIMQIKLRN